MELMSSKEYIEREKALSFPFANGKYDHANANEHFINGCETYKDWLIDIPAADVQPVRHGRWLNCKPYNPEFNGYECSECGAKYQGFSPDNYCPNCGAKMDGGINDGV